VPLAEFAFVPPGCPQPVKEPPAAAGIERPFHLCLGDTRSLSDQHHLGTGRAAKDGPRCNLVPCIQAEAAGTDALLQFGQREGRVHALATGEAVTVAAWSARRLMQFTPCTTPSFGGMSEAAKRIILPRWEMTKRSSVRPTVVAPARRVVFMASLPLAPGALLARKPDIRRMVPRPSSPSKKTPLD